MGNNTNHSRSVESDELQLQVQQQRHHAMSEEMPFDMAAASPNQQRRPRLSTHGATDHYQQPPVTHSQTTPVYHRHRSAHTAQPHRLSFKASNSANEPPPPMPKQTTVKRPKSARSTTAHPLPFASRVLPAQPRTPNPSDHSSARKRVHSARLEDAFMHGNQDSATMVSMPSKSHTQTKNSGKILVMQGWLTKLGESSKKLKRRYWKLYDNGKLTYSVKQNGAFKKYADLKLGIDHMVLRDDDHYYGFHVKVAHRSLVFFAETKAERDAWFSIIFSRYFHSGRQQLQLLQDSQTQLAVAAYAHALAPACAPAYQDNDGDVDMFNDDQKLDMPTGKGKRTDFRHRKSSFDSTKLLNATATANNTANTRRGRAQSTSTLHARNKKTPKKEDGRVIFSLHYMGQECDDKTCLSLERVHYVLKKYEEWRRSSRKIVSLGMHKYINNGLGEYYNNTQLLNDFHHLLQTHETLFTHIADYFGGECDGDSGGGGSGAAAGGGQCLLLQRLHRDHNVYRHDAQRQQIYYGYRDVHEISTQQILDKIHCYYRHAYDVGWKVKRQKLNAHRHRVTASNIHRHSLVASVNNMVQLDNEVISPTLPAADHHQHHHQQSPYNDWALSPTLASAAALSSDGDEKSADGFEDEWKLLEVCGLIQQKRAKLVALRGAQRMNRNKFMSHAARAQRYHYWSRYDDDDRAEWLVSRTHEDLKSEMLSNALYTLAPQQWLIAMESAKYHCDTTRCREIRPHKYWAQLYDLPSQTIDDMQSFAVSQSHVVAMMLYCNFDALQSQFMDTFYALENESDEALKHRHSNFYHFGRLLRELIECFGLKSYNKNVQFYHGITAETMFLETSIYIHAPLSTTTCIEVAISYSHHDENDLLLLELQDDDTVLGMARYFDCAWLSDFCGEGEKFFIGGYKPLKIQTVLDVFLGRNYCNYFRALHAMDDMFQGCFSDSASDEIKSIILHLLQTQISERKTKKKNSRQSTMTITLSEQHELDVPVNDGDDEIDLTEEDEKVMHVIVESRRKISRKISTTFTPVRRRMSTVDNEQYDYFNETPKYITKLVDYYCTHVDSVCIDWKNMTVHNWKAFNFCKSLLCHEQTEWIKMSVFLTLFPNLKTINVRNIKLSFDAIQNIYNFLQRVKSKKQSLSLCRIEICEVDGDAYSVKQCNEDFIEKFKQLGWTITFNPFEKKMCIAQL